MSDVFSPLRQARTWRDLWIALARIERELGVEIPESAIEELRAARDQIDLARVAEIEADLRHDVMAHVHHYGEVAPGARAFIHLGATSAFVADNAGLIQLKEALEIVSDRLLAAIDALAGFADRWRSLPTLGYTHWQPAQPVTVGKRAALWLQDLVADYEQVERLRGELRFRGARGTTGTEATFLDLFEGDGAKVDELNQRLADHFGFSGSWELVGQTYPRKFDHRVLAVLAGIGASVARFAQDVRLLQSYGEIEEPFGSSQIGSSAMPYKRNPMRCERAGSLARHLCVLELDAAWTASVQGFERTLDDSANRRIAIPEAFLCADAILQIVANVSSGLVVHEAVIRARLDRALPFLVTERVLIAGVRKGGDRQELHERIRMHAMAAREGLDSGAETNDFFRRVADDPAFDLDLDELDALSKAEDLVGRCPNQVEQFLTERVAPMLEGYAGSAAPQLRV
ncbi:MAG: adenylosuccinate lyase [marine benthic group bacterium]|nr:adenylosuccinate lyase [Candidatus Carthagonibacter metallireducens]MCL7964461.1 adenylosuccinate lyase [Gemmatimonadota bacterium]